VVLDPMPEVVGLSPQCEELEVITAIKAQDFFQGLVSVFRRFLQDFDRRAHIVATRLPCLLNIHLLTEHL